MYQFLQDERGIAAIEYSLFISLIGLVVAGGLYIIGAIWLMHFPQSVEHSHLYK